MEDWANEEWKGDDKEEIGKTERDRRRVSNITRTTKGITL